MKRGLPAASVALLAASTLATGCGAGFGNGNCSIRVDYVHESGNTPGEMGGKAVITCNVDVTEVRVEVRLEQEQGESWVLVKDNSDYTGKRNPFVGALKAGQERVRQVYVACALGTYRLAARGSAVLDGVPSGSAEWEYSAVKTNPCVKAE